MVYDLCTRPCIRTLRAYGNLVIFLLDKFPKGGGQFFREDFSQEEFFGIRISRIQTKQLVELVDKFN